MLRLGPAGKSFLASCWSSSFAGRPWHCLACGCMNQSGPRWSGGIRPVFLSSRGLFFTRTLVVLDVTPIKTNYICSDSTHKQSHVLWGWGWELQHIWRGRGDTFQPITWGYRWLPSHPPLCTFYFPKAEHAQQLEDSFRFASDPGTPLLTAGERVSLVPRYNPGSLVWPRPCVRSGCLPALLPLS